MGGGGLGCVCHRGKWLLKQRCRDFPGDAVAKTPCSQYRGPGSILGQGARFPLP